MEGCEEAIEAYNDLVEGRSSASVYPLKRKLNDCDITLSSDSEDDLEDDNQVSDRVALGCIWLSCV